MALVVLGSFTSLSVDVGMFFTAKLELQRAADSAALAAVAELRDGGDATSATQAAVRFAVSNRVNGQTLSSSAVSVVCGGWQNGTFAPNQTPTRAVRVSLCRTSANGNPLRLLFAQVIGLSTVDARATAMARYRQMPDYKLVGIQHASFASLGALAGVRGRLVSNGDVTVGMPLGVGVGVLGDARSSAGRVRVGTMASISGTTNPITEPLDYDSVRLPLRNDNANLALDASGNYTAVAVADVPAGVYVVHDLNLLAGVSVRLAGPVTFYVTGAFNMAATVNLLGDTNYAAKNFKVRVTSGGTVNFLASIAVPLNLDLYAPDSDIVILVGINAYKGRLISRTLDILLPAAGSFTEDTTLDDVLTPDQAVALVKLSA